ncbi:BTB/POZ domain-containing protein KCTD4 [Mizuhopecten yessoensis]|uniref:BTB/POZ domain-containing protein KCTD4 n=1 Tax=Mizuhopecten yessoensis TaxID=6573 RepID=A0A210Q9M9_MIZYE|nr:BTB/POZ domain-containing protein KCTD4 [Mizuhopecten yessoensis]
MALSQSQRLILHVWGRRYETSASTLQSEPSSILAKMVSPTSCMKPYEVDNIYTYFIDRNGKLFEHVLEFLRNGADITIRNLPNNLWVLRELIIEAEYFELDE